VLAPAACAVDLCHHYDGGVVKDAVVVVAAFVFLCMVAVVGAW
jgi:hypothetical protein